MPTVRVGDIDVYCETTGEGEPLLLIHGLGGSSLDWERQTAAFRLTYQVTTFDLRGHGRSDKPLGSYSIAQFAFDAAGLLEALQIDSAHVVGWSLGGMVAFQLAVTRPDLVRRLVVVNATPEFFLRSYSERLWLVQRQTMIRVMGMRHFAEVLSRQLFPEPSQKVQRRQMIERFSQNDPRAYLQALGAGTGGWSVTEHLQDISCPTLLITGSEDYTSPEHKAEYVAQMPDAQLVVIQDSRHGTPADQPTAFNKAVRAFLAGDRVVSEVLAEDSRKFWFPRKKRGWGWGLPVRWQGWLVYIAYFGLLYTGIRDLRAQQATLGPVLFLALLTAALLGIVAAMGERPVSYRSEEER